MDFEDDHDSNGNEEKGDQAAPAGKPADSAGAAENPEPEGEISGHDVRPTEKDHKKHEKGDHEEGHTLKGRIKKKDHEIKQLRKAQDDLNKEIGELKDKYLRAAAEMDNLRKRLEREKSEFFQFALSDVLKDLLSVLDNFERALKSGENPTDVQSFREGIELIRKHFLDLLAKRGVTPLDALHKKFDPAYHQAVLTEESEAVEEPEVEEILQAGYLLNDRLLRPALVKVIIPKKN